MQQTDIKSAHYTYGDGSNGYMISGRCRVRGYIAIGAATAGDIYLYDNASGASGVIVIRFPLHGNSTLSINMEFPGEGFLCINGCTAVIPNGASLTLMYS